MSQKSFPYTAWVLTTAYKVRKVTIASHYKPVGNNFTVAVSDTDVWYQTHMVFGSKQEAVAAGIEKLEAREASLLKQLAVVSGRLQALKGGV
jgi:hypothetical protein